MVPKWIYEENGEVWIPVQTAAKMLGVLVRSVFHLLERGALVQVRKSGRGKPHYYLLSEVEALARDPTRARRMETHEDRQEGRKLGDRTRIDETFLTAKEARRMLSTSLHQLSVFVNGGELTCYQRVVGRSPHLFDPLEVRILRRKRERLKRLRADSFDYQRWHAERCGKLPPPPKHSVRVTEKDLEPYERVMGEWLTARQVSVLLEVCLTDVYVLRNRLRLYGEKRREDPKGTKRKVLLFRKRDVLALMEDPMYRKGRAMYEAHISPKAAAIMRETRDCLHTEVSILHWDTPGAERTLTGGGNW